MDINYKFHEPNPYQNSTHIFVRRRFDQIKKNFEVIKHKFRSRFGIKKVYSLEWEIYYREL